eukprot:CAMPEP_0171623364 /NCGR_PEP_ID=MMETSP0990-20121206/17898_1 /TAXON_ID=483369 /ORGANISM="non described non described, Strain CCMP2098" /LENGTH=205 /DNA_ID=CAMNT_0012189545 /DNA_START=103 /DNA_END=720 /DNA_ORIENTATION=-
MLRTAVIALTLGSAAAFVAPKAARSITMVKAFESEVGAQPPLGLFDPLMLLDGADQERFDRLRFVEVKHGRVAMLAMVGHLTTTAGLRLPGDIDFAGTSFASISSGIKGLNEVPTGGLLQMFFAVGFLELFVMNYSPFYEGEPEFPGDFRNGFDFGWDNQSDEWKTSKRAIELNNGRAAQMGILGLMVHEELGNVLSILPPGAAI